MELQANLQTGENFLRYIIPDVVVCFPRRTINLIQLLKQNQGLTIVEFSSDLVIPRNYPSHVSLWPETQIHEDSVGPVLP
jgi:hypothetical protein